MEEKAIPKQLEGLRFCKVKFRDKKAFEKAWRMLAERYTKQKDGTWNNNITGNPYMVSVKRNGKKIKVPYVGPITNYSYKDISLYFPESNYGVMCSKELRVLDDDTPNKGLITLFIQNFGETFRVRDHLYFKFDNRHAKKIIFEHKELYFPDSNGKLSHHMGEAQSDGQYVVGPGCKHPSGELYEQKNDLPIIEISYKKFQEVFADYIKHKKINPPRQKISTTTQWSGDKVTSIPISSIISLENLSDTGGGTFQGSHPLHGSDGGSNFIVNDIDNTWFCLRCQGGGGPSELIGVMEGIIECGDAGKNCFSVEQGQEVIKVAREKYGLTIPEQDLGPVQGWANSVSITQLAKKKKMESCPVCNSAFRFEESHGLYYCDMCKYGGGLYKFALLVAKVKADNEKATKALEAL